MFDYKEEYQYPTNIMLNVTDNCNLACKYCFVEQHPHTMSINTAKKAIEYAHNNRLILKDKKIDYNKNNKMLINFFGGEPMLCYNSIIEPLILYVEKKYPNEFSFAMTSNVTLLTEDKLKFLSDHKVHLLTSIDGAEITQCYNRPCRNGENSSKLIEKNIPILLELYPNSIFRSTGYGPTIQYLYENYLYAEKLGFKNYALVLDERNEWTEEQKNTLYNELIKIQFYRLKQKVLGIPALHCNMFELTNENFPNTSTNSDNTPDTLQRCGLGTVSCAIGWDGKIYGCQQDVSLNNKNIFYIGDIYNGINKERHIRLLSKYEEEMNREVLPKCQNCLLKDSCYNTTQGQCPSTNMEIANSTHYISDIRCFWHKAIFKTSLLEIKILKDLTDQQKKEEKEKEEDN